MTQTRLEQELRQNGPEECVARRLVAAVVLAAMATVGCSPFEQFGVVPVTVGGTTVYFKREVRGLNHDETVLSPNPKLRGGMADEQTDYVFRQQGPVGVLYRVAQGRLELFVWGPLAVPPRGGRFPVTVVQHDVHPLDFRKLEREAAQRGLTALEIPLDR